MKKLYFFIFLLCTSQINFAQTIDDALLFSRYNYDATARASAMGGAFGAIGGDFSSLSINPAGIALYRSSEFTITPSLEINEVDQEKNDRFILSNIGYVASFMPRISNENEWIGVNFGFGINHVANFYRESFLSNFQSKSSRLDAWANYANGNEPDDLYPFEEKLAYDNYLINHDNNLNYFSVLAENDLMDQEQTKKEKGYINEFVLSVGANYSHKFYIGATLGIQDVYYKASTIYSEYALNGNISSLNDFTFEEFRKITGYGVNLKLGMIYKATQNLRLGAAFHTPTYYQFTNTMESFLSSNFEPGISEGFPEDGEASHSYLSEFIEYTDSDFRNPYRTILSAAYVFGKRGLISVDYEFINYANSKNNDGETEWDDGENVYVFKKDFNGINDGIEDLYKNSHNLRVGGEFRLTPELSLRAGYAHIGDPFKGSYDEDYQIYSGGIGFHVKNFFMDASYQYTDYDETINFYRVGQIASDDISYTNKKQQYKLTFGLRF